MLNTKPDPADHHGLRQSISEWRPGGDIAIKKEKEEELEFTSTEYTMDIKNGRSSKSRDPQTRQC